MIRERLAVACASAIALLSISSGCATIVHGTEQRVHFESVPPGCQVLVDGSERASTPCDLTLSRKDSHVVTFRKPGFADKTVSITQTFSGVTIFNVCIPGPCLITFGIDFLAGSAWNLTPDLINVTMSPGGASPWTGGGPTNGPPPSSTATPPAGAASPTPFPPQ